MTRKSGKVSIKAEHRLAERSPFTLHGGMVLPPVEITSYNLQLSEREKFIGDRASKKALMRLIDKWRKIVGRGGQKPLRQYAKKKISKSEMNAILTEGKPEDTGVIQSALNEFSEDLAAVIRKYVSDVPEWRSVRLVVVGGGLSGSRIGRLAIGRAQAILAKHGHKIALRPIAADPDDAALIGGLHLVPSWFLAGFGAVLAVDIGGSNVRAGVVRFKLNRRLQIVKAEVLRRKHWAHAEDDATREQIFEFIVESLRAGTKWCRRHKVRLAPFVAVACPGRIRADGTVDRGAQNLPGNWSQKSISLPKYLDDNLKVLPEQDTVVVMHNDAVVQGLSELPAIKQKEWAALTIGTGLGNATFRMRNRTARSRNR